MQAAPTGRSHRSKIGKQKLKQAIDDTRRILGVPDDYKIGIVPASDTGAIEMAMTGTATPTSSVMNMTMTGNMTGMGESTLRMKATHERVGDCG